MNILYLSSHAILEYDQTKLWTDMGHDVFSIGAYTDPAHPDVDLRPAIDAPYHRDLAEACHEQRVRHLEDDTGYPIIDWAKADLAQPVIDWADTLIVDCYPETWITFNWTRIRDKRVVWRTIGQSGPETERLMASLDGLQIVRYSPAEKRAYGSWFAGEDAMIRFAKDPADWYGWLPDGHVRFRDGTEGPYIANLAQHDTVPHGRAQFLHWPWLQAATEGLPLVFGGPNSEKIGGLGALGYDAMRDYLRRARAYVYTGTVPASYTLGLIEAMMTGVPVVSIGPGAFGTGSLFEGHEIIGRGEDDPGAARGWLKGILAQDSLARVMSEDARERAIDLFGVETIAAQWADFLGAPVRQAVAA